MISRLLSTARKCQRFISFDASFAAAVQKLQLLLTVFLCVTKEEHNRGSVVIVPVALPWEDKHLFLTLNQIFFLSLQIFRRADKNGE